MESTHVSRTTFRTAFVLLLVLVVSIAFIAVTLPFLKPLVLGALLAGLCSPLYSWVTKLLRGRKSLAALLTLLILFVVILGPFSAFIGLVVSQALAISNDAIPWVQQHLGAASAFDAHNWLIRRYPSLAAYVPDQQQITDGAAQAAKSLGAFLVAGATQFTAGTAGFLLNLFVMLYAMFYFLRDGREILEKILYYTPLSHKDEVQVLQRLISVTRATIKGTLVIGIVQGTLAGIGFRFAGIGAAAFWGTVMMVLSIVPGIGSALVWVPAVIYLYIIGHPLAATLLLLWCAVGVGTIDNLLRPKLVGKDAKMPDLLILVGTLGGLFFFGPLGFIIGPLVCGLFLTVWEIYGATFKDVLPPVQEVHLRQIEEPAKDLTAGKRKTKTS
jgi:predicted PurR-regulated permease PerM